MSFGISTAITVNSLKRINSVGASYVPLLTINDVPNVPIQHTTFTFRDIANDLETFRQTVVTNPTLQTYLSDPMTSDVPLLLRTNRVLVNVARNFCNDPSSPPPLGFIKKITILSSDGSAIVDVTTYTPQFNLDRNVIFLNTQFNILQTPAPPVYPIFQVNADVPTSIPFINSSLTLNGNFIDPTAITTTSKGIQLNEQAILVESTRTFTYPANVIDPPPTFGVGSVFTSLPNLGSAKEVEQATLQGWGWATRRENQFPTYTVANFNAGVDGYSIVIRLSYVRVA